MNSFIHITGQSIYVSTGEVAVIKHLMFGQGTLIGLRNGDQVQVRLNPHVLIAAIRIAERKGLCDIPLELTEEEEKEFLLDAGML